MFTTLMPTEGEVKCAINNLPSHKAPWPDGFTTEFFKSCWEITKCDVMKVINSFSDLQMTHPQWLNLANIVLLPKKEGVESILDYRPITLIHAIAKIIAEILVTRLVPHMDGLVSNAQSAFIRNKSIQDNFMFVRNYARWLHRQKKPSLLLKLDIKKAFDSMRWDYIFNLFQMHPPPPRVSVIGLPLSCSRPLPGSS